ncbi:hypothetical protein E2320_003643 [Naja naja]|nr:hypothetical protein E2320_003643 [Naja naja]
MGGRRPLPPPPSGQHLICCIQSGKKKKMVGMKVLHSLRPSLLLLTPPFLFLSFSPVKHPPGSRRISAESFIFYCKDQSDLTITNEGLNENTFNLRTADLNSDLIKCTCRFERAGGWPTSPQSNQLVFRVHEKYWAESFIFYCKDQSDLIITYENITKNTFKLRTADLNSDQMKIKCICWFWDPPEGWPPSPQSNQLDFFISDAPPSPGLRVDPLSQRVEEGDPLVFLCSTEGGDREKKFHFYKDGLEITSSEEGLLEPSTEPTDPLQNASLRIPHASFNHSGEFACSYEEKRSNRWIMSSLSQGVNITVEPEKIQNMSLKIQNHELDLKKGSVSFVDLKESKPTRKEQTKIFFQEILNHPFFSYSSNQFLTQTISEVVQWAQWFPCLESQMAPDVVGGVDREILQGRRRRARPGFERYADNT